MQTTIKDLQAEVERRFSESLRDLSVFAGFRPRISIHATKDDRKHRTDVKAERFSPESEYLKVVFEPATEPASTTAVASDRVSIEDAANASQMKDTTAALIRNLNEAESRPGYDFVSLKWFRDSVMPALQPEWSDRDARDSILREAIAKRVILTSKVPNPKSPMFPVTAIRLNRSAPEAQAVLGSGEKDTRDEFSPVPIRGEALSATVRRERR